MSYESHLQAGWAREEWHFGRSFDDTRLEDACPCAKAPCGLVVTPSDDCTEHPFQYAKTIRQSHMASDCPAAQPDPRTDDRGGEG